MRGDIKSNPGARATVVRAILLSFAILITTAGLQYITEAQQSSQTQPSTEQGPRLSLNPGTGFPGSVVTVRGSGFRGDCGVRLFFDTESGAPLSSGDVDKRGTFSSHIEIPEEATDGDHVVLAHGLRRGTRSCTEPSNNKAQASFILNPRPSIPAIIINTLEARPGGSVHIEGRGFCVDQGCSNVTVLIDGQVAADNVKLSSGGSFSTDAKVPAIKTSGTLTVVAIQTKADQTEVQAFGELEVTPRPNIPRKPPS